MRGRSRARTFKRGTPLAFTCCTNQKTARRGAAASWLRELSRRSNGWSRSGVHTRTLRSRTSIASTQASALDRAEVTFGDRTLAAVAHASTTTGYVVGKRDEADLVERLAYRFQVPAVVSSAAAVAASPAA